MTYYLVILPFKLSFPNSIITDEEEKYYLFSEKTGFYVFDMQTENIRSHCGTFLKMQENLHIPQHGQYL